MTKPLTFGSLFSGIGGIDLGLERAGIICKWQSEIDSYSSRVLKKHWPNVPNHGDITKMQTDQIEKVDLICGGFPCQDISFAGKGAGLKGGRSGLFYELIRIVRGIRPQYLLLENVSALLVRGVDDVLGTLAALGYDCEWHCIPAAALGAPHRRDRIFILADANDSGDRASKCKADKDGSSVVKGRQEQPQLKPSGQREDVATANCNGCRKDAKRQPNPGSHAGSEIFAQEKGEKNILPNSAIIGRKRLPKKQVFRIADLQNQFMRIRQGERNFWATKPGVGRVANGISNRVDRIRGLGNAVVPQISEWIGLNFFRGNNENIN